MQVEEQARRWAHARRQWERAAREGDREASNHFASIASVYYSKLSLRLCLR